MAEPLTTARALDAFYAELVERGFDEDYAAQLTRDFLPILADNLGVAVRDA